MRDERRKFKELQDLTDAVLAGRGDAVARIEMLMDGVTRLLDGEVGGFNHVDIGAPSAFVLLRPKVVANPSEPLLRTLDIHPLVIHYRQHPEDTGPTRLSDHVPGRVTDHPIYAELLGHMKTPNMITIPLPWKGTFTEASAYAVTRSGRDFRARDLEFAHTIQFALQLVHRTDCSRDAVVRLHLLPDAEREVIELVGRGLKPEEIANLRHTSPKTVRKQIAKAYAKLGIHDRAAVRELLAYGPTVPHPADRLKEVFG